MAKFDIKTVKPKFVVTTSPENKIDVVVNKPIIESKNSKSFFQLKNTGGPKGEKGDQGEPGKNATITVASTSTGAPGTDASVVNQGTETDAQLAFTIPRGDKGDKGDTGAAGFTPQAWVVRGDDYAQIFIEGEHSTSQAKVYDGTDGQDGQAATITVDSTTTLPAGSSATVTNVGTSSAASLAFGIPKGDTGAAGQDGFSPTATVTQTSGGATISITDKDGTTTADVSNGTDGADGDAATITVGTVETLAPNESAYVTNVGTSSAAIFNIGIPQGQKGESGSGSGDMSQVDYDPNSTVKNAGGIPAYVSGQLPGDMTGATSSAAGTHGLVPAPAAGDQGKALMGDGTWKDLPSPELVEMVYGESNAWAKFIAAYNAHCIVYCRASSNSNPATGSQTRKAFMAYVNNADSPTSVEFQYYRSVSSKSDSQQGDQVFVYTLTNASGGTWSVTTRNTFSKVVAGTNMTSSYSSGTLTLNATQPTVPTKTSDLTNDGADGTSTYVEADELPAVNDATLTITQNGTSAGTFTANASSNTTIALTDTTYNAMTGASSSTAGTSGLVPAPSAGDQNDVLKGDGTWDLIGTNNLNDFNTANTVDTWIPVFNNDLIQHRIIKPFNADGSIPTSAIADGAVTADKLANTDSWVLLGEMKTTQTSTGTFLSVSIPAAYGNASFKVSAKFEMSDTTTGGGWVDLRAMTANGTVLNCVSGITVSENGTITAQSTNGQFSSYYIINATDSYAYRCWNIQAESVAPNGNWRTWLGKSGNGRVYNDVSADSNTGDPITSIIVVSDDQVQAGAILKVWGRID